MPKTSMPMKPKAAVVIAAGPAEPDADEKGKIIVPMPQGMDDEGKKPGETIDAVCEFEIEPDGKSLCLKKINGIAMEGYKSDQDGDEEQSAPDNTFAGMVTGQPAEEA